MLWTTRSFALRPGWWLHPPRSSKRPFSFTPNSYSPRISRPINGTPHFSSFREQVARVAGVKAFSEIVSSPSIGRQILCFVVGSFVTYHVAAKAANYDTAYWTKRLTESGSLVWKIRTPTSDELRRARYYELGKHLQTGLASLKEAVQGLPQTLGRVAVWTYVQVAQPILDTTEGKRICWAIGAVNTAVWMAWQFPRFQPFMMRHFTHNPLTGLSYTMLTCIFSHKSFIHLLVNSMALASFGSAASQHLMREQAKNPQGLPEASIKWHFLAFYITAGLCSSLTSHILMSKVRFPQTVSKLMNKPATAPATSSATKGARTSAANEPLSSGMGSSLGASGAIYGTVALTALAFPDTEIALIIPPSFPIPIQWGVGGMIALDLLGALRGWRLFDHYAHLGGAAFGMCYYEFGTRIWNTARALDVGVSAKQIQKGS